MPRSSTDAAPSRFWRDPALPWVEARAVPDGRLVCYERHWHETFSIGAITSGRSTYLNGDHAEEVAQGSLVIMHPGEVHACNPIDGEAWSYRMLYVDAAWLAELQGSARLQPFGAPSSRSPELYDAFNTLFDTLLDPQADPLPREEGLAGFFTLLGERLGSAAPPDPAGHAGAEAAAEWIDARFAQPLRLGEIAAAAGLSVSQLVRAFRKRYGMGPHEYQVNRRVQHGRAQLRQGVPIAEAALAAGFADQAHFQRAFKRLSACTPGQYRG